MRILRLSILFILLVGGCGGQNLPDNYGIYVYSDKGRVVMTSQRVLFAGNLIESIAGLKGTSGAGYSSVKHFIVFEKDINPRGINLARLEFKKGASVQNIFGKNYVDVNLWIPAQNIEMDISPIDGKKDMYKLTPKQKLAEGFYALHFGSMGSTSTIEASMGRVAFDFVIGNVNDYQSHEIIEKKNEEKLKAEAVNLLKSVNNYFNQRDYAKMREIYRPDGKVLTDVEWQQFTNGLGTWLSDAGRITDSTIANSTVTPNEGTFQIQTTYEKKGQQAERLVVRLISGKYYITSLE